jgi:hypothetical protein
MNTLRNVFFHWLPLGASVVLISGLSYVGIQQNIRSSLNEPQIELVARAQSDLVTGTKTPAEIVGRGTKFDMEQSLDAFTAVYDESGNVLEASAYVNNAPPRIPDGVLAYAKAHGEDRVTWQPNSNTRIALVVRPVAIESGWFVASGRNMMEGENRIKKITQMFVVGIIATLIVSFALDVIGDRYRQAMMKRMNNQL